LKEIEIEEAKATLSAVVDRALSGEPSVITRHGRREVVVLALGEYEKPSKVPSFGELLDAFPGGVEDVRERGRKPTRGLRKTGF
jgi:prevent-host-death family protein